MNFAAKNIRQIFLKSFLFFSVITLTACLAVPEDVNQVSADTGQRIDSEAAGVYQPRVKSTRKPPRALINDEVNPAVISLVSSARELKNRGEYPACAAKLERALRIDPKSVSAYTLLAEVRLLQQQHVAADQLARKAMAILAQRKQSSAKEQQMEHLRFIIAEAQHGMVQ